MLNHLSDQSSGFDVYRKVTALQIFDHDSIYFIVARITTSFLSLRVKLLNIILPLFFRLFAFFVYTIFEECLQNDRYRLSISLIGNGIGTSRLIDVMQYYKNVL